MQLKALLLDLDGTLVDTAPDMVGSLNRLLTKHKRPLADPAVAGLLVSNGARGLLQHGFGENVEEAGMNALIDEFLEDYAQHVCEQSQIYGGMEDALLLCQQYDIKWGVVTNKPLQLSRALLQGLGILENCAILLGGDSLPVKKPDPAPLLHCCMALSLAASECLYVGDHERDIQAGNAAGMDTAVALWGYINGQQSPADWNANFLFNTPGGLAKLIGDKLSN